MDQQKDDRDLGVLFIGIGDDGLRSGAELTVAGDEDALQGAAGGTQPKGKNRQGVGGHPPPEIRVYRKPPWNRAIRRYTSRGSRVCRSGIPDPVRNPVSMSISAGRKENDRTMCEYGDVAAFIGHRSVPICYRS